MVANLPVTTLVDYCQRPFYDGINVALNWQLAHSLHWSDGHSPSFSHSLCTYSRAPTYQSVRGLYLPLCAIATANFGWKPFGHGAQFICRTLSLCCLAEQTVAILDRAKQRVALFCFQLDSNRFSMLLNERRGRELPCKQTHTWQSRCCNGQQ